MTGEAPAGAFDEPRARLVLYVSMVGMLATGFPFTILTVALKPIALEFGVSEALAAWTVSAPMLISAAALPLLGKLGDMFGHRRMFVWGILGSSVFAGLCILAWDIWSLIGFRILSMLVAGATGPSAMALLFHVYPPDKRTQAVSWWSMSPPGAAALGLILGGPFVDLFGWRSVFVVQTVTGFAALWLALRFLPETPTRPERFDHAGNVMLIVALSFLLFAVGAIGEAGIPLWVKLSATAAGFAGLAAFFAYEAGVRAPIVPPYLLIRRNFVLPVATSFLIQASYLGALIATPLVLIGQFGFSVSVAAALMLTRTASLTVASPVGGQIASRFGERFGAWFGAAIQALGLFVVGAAIYYHMLPLVMLGLVLQGIGHGFALPPLTSIIATAVSPTMFGTASGVSRLVGQVGSAFGISVFGVLLSYPDDMLSLPAIFAIGAVIAVAAIVPAALISMRHRAQGPAAPQ